MINKKYVYALMLLPVLLFAWGEDSYITSTNSSQYPVSYDLVIPNDTMMFCAYEFYDYNNSNLNTFRIYMSQDTGRTWSYLNGFYYNSDSSSLYNEIALDYMYDSLIVFFPSKYLDMAYVILLPFADLSAYSLRGPIVFSMDTVLDIKFQKVYADNIHHLYAMAMGKSADTSLIEVLRSDDNGNTWNSIIRRNISWSSDIALRLLDFAARPYGGDTIELVYAESYTNTSNNDYSIYYEVWRDVISQSPVNISGLHVLKSTGNYRECAVDIHGNMIVWTIVDSYRLYFAWSTDDGNTIQLREYPYNSDFTTIYKIDMVTWYGLWGGGFNLSFVGYDGTDTRVWYQEIIDYDDSIGFSDYRGMVSDSNTYTYLANFSPYYRPRIKNYANLLTPAIMWHNDYYHLVGTPPIPIYDSTQFYIDYMAYTNVAERHVSESNLKVNLTGDVLKAEVPFRGKLRVRILDIAGRVTEERVIEAEGNTVSMDISSLKHGIYFMTVEGENRVLKGKFIKLR